jgi:uncharacterized cofD-like protein
VVVIGPGSLFTSVIVNALVPGIREALNRTKALKIYVCNIVTQPGQTDAFTASDHVRTVVEHLGPDAVDYAVVNSHIPSATILERYRAEGAEIVPPDGAIHEIGPRVVEADLMEDLDGTRILWEKQDLLRHHPDKLADTVCRIYAGLTPPQSPIQKA